MKYIKKFENISKNEEPKIGDYVIIDTNGNRYPHLKNFILNNIGQVINKNIDNLFLNGYIIVKYNKVPKKVKHEVFDNINNINFRKEIDDFGKMYYTIKISTKLVKFYSEYKDDVEMYLTTRNFNL